MTLKHKIFMVTLAVWFWAFSHYPKLTEDWSPWQQVSALAVAAILMFIVVYYFFKDDNQHDPKDFVWYNYERPLDPFHWPKQSGFYFYSIDKRSFYGPYATNAEAEFFFREHAKAWPKESGETKYLKRSVRGIRD